jgi:pimeloyl-ACP methyl ester carboxylesterase
MTPRRHWVDANGVRLSVLELGDPAARPLVMLHGMRDVAASLLPIAEPLAREWRVLLPELRGHGASDQPGCYTLEHYLYDQNKVMDALGLVDAVWFGHSLGGQIVVRLAAIFPQRVTSAIVVEGLGPPDRPGQSDPDRWLMGYGQRLMDTLGIPERQRTLPGVEFAAGRLLANNPRLGAERAQMLAAAATRRTPTGELVWAFDPRVRSVFVSFIQPDEAAAYRRNVRCPVLAISGDLAHEYWRAQMPFEWDGRFAPGELEARIREFPDHEHVAIPGAGHMVHFDEPAALIQAATDFLERRA